ncbi:MAG: four helix bundle protein [Pirellulales bacterium]
MRNFQKLDVWKKAHELTLSIYRLTICFPANERYGLTSQLQRAAASIGANLAEGCGRETDADYKRFVQMASGSACEVEYHLILARDLGLVDRPTYDSLNTGINEIKRMLCGLTNYLDSEIADRKPR